MGFLQTPYPTALVGKIIKEILQIFTRAQDRGLSAEVLNLGMYPIHAKI